MTVTNAKSSVPNKIKTPLLTSAVRATAACPESQQEAKDDEISPGKAKFQIFREDILCLPTRNKIDETKIDKDICVEGIDSRISQSEQTCAKQSEQCPFLFNSNHAASKTKSNKRCKKPASSKQSGRSQQPPLTEAQLPTAVAPSFDTPPHNGPSNARPDTLLQGAAPARRTVAPLWSRARLLATTRADSLPRRSDIEGATCATELIPEPWWAPAPIDHRRRSKLFGALRDANRQRNASTDRAVEDAVRAVLYRKHPELIVQRFCQPPASLYGAITIEEFIVRPTRPVHVLDDLFLGPATLSRDEMVSMIRSGQYHRGCNVACFYAYLYSYEFVYFCEFLRHVECHTLEARAVLRGVLQRAQNMHLISHSATIFSLAPEVMYPQRSPFLYLARLFPMQEPWEADLLCDMINSRDLVKEAAAAWNRGEHVLFTTHSDMRRQARLQGRPEPPFHPAVTQQPSSAAAFSNIEGEQVERLDSHGLVVFQESGASYTDVDACCRFAPLGELSTEDVLRRSVGRHALIRLFDDVFFVGAPPVDLHRAQIRYLRPAEVRLHVQVGFFFDSPSYASFLWSTQQNVNRALHDACRMHAPQLSSEETALVRWFLHVFADTSRRALHHSSQDMARFGPYLLNEYGKTLWRVLSDDRFETVTLQLCTDLAEHARSMLEACLAEHNCLAGN